MAARRLTKREKYVVTIITKELVDIKKDQLYLLRPDQYDKEKSYWLAGYEAALKTILELITED